MSDCRRPIASKVGRWSFATAIVLTVGLRLVQCADDSKSGLATPNAKPANGAGPAIERFDLRIVGPDGKPLPDTKIELQSTPALKDVRMRAGRYVNTSRYFGVQIRSDAEGKAIFERPAHLDYLNVTIKRPGYASYWATWRTNTEPIPASFTAKMTPAWTIGGIVVDGSGKPVPNARVLLSVAVATRQGGMQATFAERAWTNAKGAWRYESIPNTMNQVVAEISQPSFMAIRPTLSREKFCIEPGHEPAATITLKSGFTVTGKITDETGKPISKALVRTRFQSDYRSAWTGKDGVYQLEGCEPGNVAIVASAKHRAPAMQQVAIAPQSGPVNFELKPGNTIRIRALDEQGRPALKAQIYVQNWRGQYFDFVQAPHEADVDGVWEWTEAPPDEVEVSISRPGGMTLGARPVVARQEEYVFRVPPALVVAGKVIDAESKQPIRKFRFAQGYRWMGTQLIWEQGNAPSSEGTYKVQSNYEQPGYLVRIEADGYLHAVSREIKSDEGHVTIDFELLKGKSFAATVMTPDGVPAAGAKIALVATGQLVRINQGEFDKVAANADVQEADAAGRFRQTTKNNDFRLVVVHRSGYAELMGLPSSSPPVIKLRPWARIEGTFQAGRKPQADVQISLTSANLFAQNMPSMAVDLQTTDSHGRFAFDRVIPGQQRLTAKRVNGEGAAEMTSSSMLLVDCADGKTAHVTFGTTGRPVIGQLRRPRDDQSGGALNSAQIMIRRDGSRMPDFTATADRDGNFCIEDVPPGDYTLNAFVPRAAGPRMQVRRFTVPTTIEKLSQRPVDLGVLPLFGAQDRAQRIKARESKASQ